MKRDSRFLYVLLTSFMIVALADMSVVSSETAHIYLDPALLYEAPGSSISVDVRIEEVVELYSWQVNMSFNPSVLEFINVTEGDFLVDQPEGTSSAIRKDKAEQGWVMFGWATIGAYLGVTGSGSLATVEFTVSGTGQSAINMSNPKTKLIKMNPPPVPPGGSLQEELPYTAESGLFSNVAEPPAAEFTYSPSLPELNEEITFDASASSAVSPYVIDTYKWDFGDGTEKTYVRDVNLTSTATHTYTVSGVYEVSLTIIDDADMPLEWYELYSTKTITLNIRFGHDIALTNLAASPTEVTAGETVTVTVTVANSGVEVETNIAVTAYYGTSAIDTKQIATLAPGATQTLTFEWDTSNVPAGDYQIRAEAPLEGDGVPANNNRIDGTVTVNPVSEPFPLWIIAVVVVVVIAAVIALIYMRRK